jgi:hypothetical protein
MKQVATMSGCDKTKPQWSAPAVRCPSPVARLTRSTSQRVRMCPPWFGKNTTSEPIVAHENATSEPTVAHENAPNEPNAGSRKCAERTQPWLTKMRRTNPNARAAARAAERDKTKPFLAIRSSELMLRQWDRTTEVFCETNPPVFWKTRRTNPPDDRRECENGPTEPCPHRRLDWVAGCGQH